MADTLTSAFDQSIAGNFAVVAAFSSSAYGSGQLVGHAITPGTSSGSFAPAISALASANAELTHEDFLFDFYYRFWVTPDGLQSLGSVATEQHVRISVWNAFPDQSHVLSAVAVTGLDGAALDIPAETPITFSPLQSLDYTLKVYPSGPPDIDITVRFSFTGLSDQQVEFLGNRARLWEFPLDWSTPPLDRYSWLTDVIPSYDNSESRAALLEEPRRTLEATFTVKRERLARLDALLYGWGARPFVLPVWTDSTALTGAAAAGDLVLACDTTSREFAPGGYALVGADPTTMTACLVESVSDGALSLARPFVGAAASGTPVFPARIGRLIGPVQQQQASAALVRQRVSFQIDDQPFYAGTPTGTTFNGLQVFLRGHNWADGINRAYTRMLTVLDNTTGLPEWIDQSNFPSIMRSANLVLRSRADRWNFLQWLYSVMGRLTPFYKENRETVMQVSPRQSGASTNVLHVLPFGFVDFLYQQPQRLALILRHTNGTIYYRNIVTASVDGGSGDELIVLDATIPGSVPSDWLLVSYLELVRLSADAIEIAHVSEEVSQVAISFVGVKQ